MSDTRVIVVHCKETKTGGLTVKVERGTHVLDPDCERVVWQFEGLPPASSWQPDIVLKTPSPLSLLRRDATTVELHGNPVGTTPFALFYQVCVHGRGGTFTAKERSIAVPSARPGSRQIVARVGFHSGRKQLTLDQEELVLIGVDPAVRWDFAQLKPSDVEFSFTDARGVTTETGPFERIERLPDSYAWVGAGDREKYSRYSCAIRVNSPLLLGAKNKSAKSASGMIGIVHTSVDIQTPPAIPPGHTPTPPPHKRSPVPRPGGRARGAR
jgi:hypothetical protein